VASYYANPAMAAEIFGWKAELDVNDMCRDAWAWQAKRAGINDL
jgi:UDP-glucose 4-epimerase